MMESPLSSLETLVSATGTDKVMVEIGTQASGDAQLKV